jgi:hypothetical protein
MFKRVIWRGFYTRLIRFFKLNKYDDQQEKEKHFFNTATGSNSISELNRHNNTHGFLKATNERSGCATIYPGKKRHYEKENRVYQ